MIPSQTRGLHKMSASTKSERSAITNAMDQLVSNFDETKLKMCGAAGQTTKTANKHPRQCQITENLSKKTHQTTCFASKIRKVQSDKVFRQKVGKRLPKDGESIHEGQTRNSSTIHWQKAIIFEVFSDQIIFVVLKFFYIIKI